MSSSVSILQPARDEWTRKFYINKMATKKSSKKSNNQNKPKSKPPAQQKTKQKKSVPAPLVKKVCGLTDPFCVHARNAKYPDESSIRSLPFSYHARVTLSSQAQGYNWTMFLPQFAYTPYTSGLTAVSTQVTSWNDFASASVLANVQSYRIVSCGYILRNIAPALTASGMVRVRGWPVTSGTTLTTVDLASYSGTFSIDIPLLECKELPVIIPHTAQLPQTIYNVSSDSATVSGAGTKGFVFTTICVDGAPASIPVLDVEFFIHYELIFDDSTAMQLLATPSPAPSTAVKAAAARVSSTIAGYVGHSIEEGSKFVAKKALAGLTSYFLGPTAGLIADGAMELD